MFRKAILAIAVIGAMSLPAFAACNMGMQKGMACGDKNMTRGCDKSAKLNASKQRGACGMQSGMQASGGCCVETMSLATVKLSAEQKTKIEAIDEEFRGEMAKLRIKDRQTMQDPFVTPNGFSKEAFKKERIEKMQKHLDLKAEQLAKIWEVLTPEQQKSITALSK